VRENLWLAARRGRAKSEAADRVGQLIDRLSLGDIAGRLVGELAHGQRQWVEIGMVMLREPKLMLLDEPSAGMSAEETDRTAALIREINRTVALVVVEHDMQFIRQIATRVTVFHQGQILVEDSFDRIMRDPRVRDVYLGRHAA
jgi:branched-chain amino acid transport system ATP-binding protein/urea transport system ATP-binding protein